MGGGDIIRILLVCSFLLLLEHSSAHPICTDSRAPFVPKTPLSFCSYTGSACCDAAEDSTLRKQFQAMNISDSGCASLVKSVLCSRCDQFSGDLYRVDSNPRTVPVLCNSTIAGNTSQSFQGKSDFCAKVWDTCQNVSSMNSLFAASLQGLPNTSKFTKLTDFWQSKTDFCNVFGGSSSGESVCFDGGPVTLELNNSTDPGPLNGMCLEKIGNGSYLNMAAHPDGSGRAFFSNQQGKIWLATVPKVGSGGTLELYESNPFLDLTDEVQFDTEFGMMGIAFHPNFAQNGRFFASFNCDKGKWPGCAGRCSCNSDVDCDPSKLSPDNGARPCQYHAVIAEYSVKGTATQISLAERAKPSEVRRIFTMGLPFTGHHGGQILFGPADGYLYFMMGDGGGVGDPYNFAQNKKSLLGKIIRLDVNSSPSEAEVSKLSLWGNYSIPKDNPFTEDKDLQPEIWALGFRNPWRCSFDSERPSYFMCADVGQDRYEEVNIVSKGGNYGWRAYEGSYPYTPPETPGGNTSLNSIRPIFPVMGYNHSAVNKNEGSASITGGYFYRSTSDPCMYGRYLFADLYASGIWAGTESPENSGNFTTSQIPFSCAPDSPIGCSSVPGSSDSALGYIFSFGEDNSKDTFILASSGVYRVVRPSRCKYTCAKENTTGVVTPTAPGSSTPSLSNRLNLSKNSVIGFSSLVLLLILSFL